MKEILLTHGKVTLVDSCFYPYLSQWEWCYYNGYAIRYITIEENGERVRKRIWLHRVILGLYDESLVVDHINGDTLLNTKENLRICEKQENSWNRRGVANTSSIHKGVTNRSGNYRARISINGKSFSIGTYSNEDAAANAYNHKALELFGSFARLNNVIHMSKEECNKYKTSQGGSAL